MKYYVMILLTVVVSMALVFTNSAISQEKKVDSVLEDIFNSIDTDKNGKISQHEWNSIDTNKDGKIDQKEWERYTYKSPPEKKSKWFDIKWFDYNSDGYMDKDEFFKHNKRQP